MNLYLLTQDINNDYDTYDSCIVCAESKADAKTITPCHSGKFDTSWCSSPDEVKSKKIGIAGASIKRGLVLSSFNAG